MDMNSLRARLAGQHYVKRTLIMLMSVIFMGIGVGFFMTASMGSDPFSTLNLGVSSKIGLSFGTWQVFLNVILLLIVVFLDRSKLGLGTIGNMILVGFSADIWGGFLGQMIVASELGILARVGMTLLGVAMQILGVSFYVTCGLGMAPYDAISYIGPALTHIPFRWWRIITDMLCVGIGFACGAAIGIGTIIMAFGTGPLVPFCNKYVAEPIINGKGAKKAS